MSMANQTCEHPTFSLNSGNAQAQTGTELFCGLSQDINIDNSPQFPQLKEALMIQSQLSKDIQLLIEALEPPSYVSVQVLLSKVYF